jgi:heme exporter protein D
VRGFDFSSWQAVLSTLLGLAIITLLGVGIRLLLMQTVQQRRERENRQINEMCVRAMWCLRWSGRIARIGRGASAMRWLPHFK